MRALFQNIISGHSIGIATSTLGLSLSHLGTRALQIYRFGILKFSSVKSKLVHHPCNIVVRLGYHY